MHAQSMNDDSAPALPRMVAEVLVRRLSASEVAERAKQDGLPGSVADLTIKICRCQSSASPETTSRTSAGAAAR